MGEANLDQIDRLTLGMERVALDKVVPNWPEHCRRCITGNGLNPANTLYCPPDNACPYYPTPHQHPTKVHKV